MEEPFPDIFNEINETTFNLFSNQTDDPVDDYDIPHMDNQSSEDVNVYKSIEDNKSDIQATIDSTPSEPKKKEPVKLFAVEKKKRLKKLKMK